MGLSLYSEDTFVTDVGSSNSWNNLTKVVRAFHRYPKLLGLMVDGMSKDPVGVRAELDILLAKEKLSANHKAKLDMLSTSLRKVKELAIVSE